MTKRILLLCCACMLIVVGVFTTVAEAGASFGKEEIKQGAAGGDVYELQGRLKYLGFYQGKIDGQFGQRTYRAVRQFQSQFGLKVDGVVGPKTKRELVEATKAWAPGLSNRIYKKGDRGGYVWELQRRLRYIGFYPGKVDGKFESQTDRAVRDFQYRFGLKVDGKAGPKTKLKLWRATRDMKTDKGAKAQKKKKPAMTQVKPMKKVSQNTGGLSKQDIHLMSRAVYAEGRGEPYVGKVAIAAVILNRLESEKFPDSVSGIIYEPLAFEAVSDGQINMSPEEESKKAVRDALNGWDPSGGALYYFNPDKATSDWIWGRPQIKRIGKHIFTN